jgi:hypothetical protein
VHGNGLIGVFIVIGIFLLRKILKAFADSADAKVKAQRQTRASAATPSPSPPPPRVTQRRSLNVPTLEEERTARAARLAARRAAFEQAAKASAERQRREQEAEVAAITGAAIIPPQLTPAPGNATTSAGVEDPSPYTPIASPPSFTAQAVMKAPVLDLDAPTGPAPVSPWLVALRDPASARKAILLKEILGTPVGLR